MALPSSEIQALECVKAGLETWEYTAKNALMYYPEGTDIYNMQLSFVTNVQSFTSEDAGFYIGQCFFCEQSGVSCLCVFSFSTHTSRFYSMPHDVEFVIFCTFLLKE